jgi:RNA polymerase sigma factor (sigma-70 family)
MLPGSPEAIFAILRSASSAAPDPRLDEVLAEFRRRWLAIGRRRYSSLGDDLEDAVQDGLVKLIAPERLDGIADVSRLEAWARSVFINTVLSFARDDRCRRKRNWVLPAEEDPEDVLRNRLPAIAPTPEQTAAHRERLRIIAGCVYGLEVARLKFVDDLSDKEIAARRHLTRDGVAGQLKRIRRSLRAALGEDGQ